MGQIQIQQRKMVAQKVWLVHRQKIFNWVSVECGKSRCLVENPWKWSQFPCFFSRPCQTDLVPACVHFRKKFAKRVVRLGFILRCSWVHSLEIAGQFGDIKREHQMAGESLTNPLSNSWGIAVGIDSKPAAGAEWCNALWGCLVLYPQSWTRPN